MLPTTEQLEIILIKKFDVVQVTLHSDIIKFAGVSSPQVHNQRDYSDYKENQFPNKIFIPSQNAVFCLFQKKRWGTEDTTIPVVKYRENISLSLHWAEAEDWPIRWGTPPPVAGRRKGSRLPVIRLWGPRKGARRWAWLFLLGSGFAGPTGGLRGGGGLARSSSAPGWCDRARFAPLSAGWGEKSPVPTCFLPPLLVILAWAMLMHFKQNKPGS